MTNLTTVLVSKGQKGEAFALQHRDSEKHAVLIVSKYEICLSNRHDLQNPGSRGFRLIKGIVANRRHGRAGLSKANRLKTTLKYKTADRG